MVYVVVAVAPFDAQGHAVDRRLAGACHAHDLAIAHVEIEVAAHTAVGAGRAHLFDPTRAALAQAHLVVQGAHWTIGHALAAAFAAGIEHVLVSAGHQLGLEPAIGKAPDVPVLDLAAGADTAAAEDALVAIDEDERIGIGVDVPGVPAPILFGPRDSVVVYQVLQLAVAVDLADHAGVGMVGEEHLQHEFARRGCVGAAGVYHHALEHRGGAGRLQTSGFFHRHHAHAACAHIAQVRVVAQGGDFDPDPGRGFEDGGAVGGVNASAVDGELGHGTDLSGTEGLLVRGGLHRQQAAFTASNAVTS